MSSAHVIYIGVILMIGFVGGFVWGRKTLTEQLERRKEELRRRKAARQAREAEGSTADPA